MSSDGDQIAVHNSLNDNAADAADVPFNDKSYTFITDSTSNSGSFSSGQIQFDLSTLNSQSQWISLSEAMIEFPIKITTQLKTAIVTGSITNAAAQAASVVIKNGWHQWIDSCQMTVNGQCIQAAQTYENVASSFRILSKWSQDTLVKLGPTCGVALDDCTGVQATSTVSNTTGLGNATYSTVATSVKGLDVINNQASLFNRGIVARNNMTNYDINPYSSGTTGAPNVQTTILGAASMKTAGRPNVSIVSTTGSNTADAYLHCAYYMATCRLKDLMDIDDYPLQKNLKGFLYLSFNSSQVSLTGTLTGAPAVTATLASVAITPLTGRTTPFMINNSATGITLGSSSSGTVAAVVQVVGSVDATTTGVPASGSCGPLLTNARLVCPYYLANPRTDSALTQTSKFFTTLEKIVNPITVAAGTSVNYTITTGVPNARKLVILPMWQNLGDASLTNPETSPFDSVPATSGPFAVLNNFQVYLGNKPIYQYPIQYDFEQWNTEQTSLGLNGAMISEQTSGLLSQQLWEQNHRYYYVDLSRRLDSEDGQSKSVQVSFSNPSSTFGMKCIAIVFYEKRWVMNTATGQISSV